MTREHKTGHFAPVYDVPPLDEGQDAVNTWMDQLPIHPDDASYWYEAPTDPVSVTLTQRQWGAVLAMFEGAASVSHNPGMIGWAHRAIRTQLNDPPSDD